MSSPEQERSIHFLLIIRSKRRPQSLIGFHLAGVHIEFEHLATQLLQNVQTAQIAYAFKRVLEALSCGLALTNMLIRVQGDVLRVVSSLL